MVAILDTDPSWSPPLILPPAQCHAAPGTRQRWLPPFGKQLVICPSVSSASLHTYNICCGLRHHSMEIFYRLYCNAAPFTWENVIFGQISGTLIHFQSNDKSAYFYSVEEHRQHRRKRRESPYMSRAAIFHRGTSSLTRHCQPPCYTPESKAQPIIPSTPPHTSLSSSLLLSVMTGLETQSLPHCWIEDSNPRWDTIFNPKPWFCFSIQKANIMFTIYCLLCGDDKSFEDDSSARPWYSMEIVSIADSDDVLNASLSFPHIYIGWQKSVIEQDFGFQ